MVVVWGSLKVWRHTIEGLPDPTEVFQSQQTLVGKPISFFFFKACNDFEYDLFHIFVSYHCMIKIDWILEYKGPITISCSKKSSLKPFCAPKQI